MNYITGQTYCFSCGFKDPIQKILGIKQDEDSERLHKYLALSRQWEEDEVPQEYEITLPPVDFYINESIRGIPIEILKELGVYYCSHGRYKGRLIFPIRDMFGNLLSFDARIYEHQDRPKVKPEVPMAKYLRPTQMKTSDILYPLDYLHNHQELDQESIVLCEGIFDALSYIALGVPALCNFGLGSPSITKVSHLVGLGCEKISSGFDHDEAGINGWQRIKEEWRAHLLIDKPHGLTKKIWACGKDANEYIKELKVC